MSTVTAENPAIAGSVHIIRTDFPTPTGLHVVECTCDKMSLAPTRQLARLEHNAHIRALILGRAS